MSKFCCWLETIYNAAKNKLLTTGGTVLLTILNSDFGVASDTLIRSVQQAIDPDEYAGEGYGAAPIGHVVKVESAMAKSVTVKTDITFETGYGWANLQNLIDDAISSYLLELRKAWADSPYLVVRISQIETRLLSIKGVVDISGTKLNGVADNLTLGQYEVPVFGGASA
ncbi:MAG: baseplate J/gp47 family protein [Clostridium sp.]|nr:baseplate J/gp47 family protein [Clostridium sp.]